MLSGRYFVLSGIGGTHFQGFRVQAKKGAPPSPSLVPGGKTCTVRVEGGDVPGGVGGAEKEKRARCLGMFQFKRPL
jgi:hypothetical protein